MNLKNEKLLVSVAALEKLNWKIRRHDFVTLMVMNVNIEVQNERNN